MELEVATLEQLNSALARVDNELKQLG